MPTRYAHCCRQMAETNRSWNPVQLNMLLETDEYESAEELVKMETKASSQCSQAAFCALKMVPEAKTGGPGSFINIRQGATEIYLDFIDWLQEAIQKQVESREAVETLLLQLAYENANNDCKAVLNPLRLTTINTSQCIKACQNIGMEPHWATLLAAAIKWEIKCFNCGRLGHTHRECQNKQQNNRKTTPSKDCPQCGKGKF